MAIKKAFQPIVDILETNKNSKVSDILNQVISLASAKTASGAGSSTLIRDKKGTVVAILDYYFKRYMPLVGPKAVEFGKKEKTASGYNTMCKEGVAAWTKQQREAKNAMGELFTKVKSGIIKPADIAAEEAKIEAARKVIAKTDLGFATLEEVKKYLVENKVEL